MCIQGHQRDREKEWEIVIFCHQEQLCYYRKERIGANYTQNMQTFFCCWQVNKFITKEESNPNNKTCRPKWDKSDKNNYFHLYETNTPPPQEKKLHSGWSQPSYKLLSYGITKYSGFMPINWKELLHISLRKTSAQVVNLQGFNWTFYLSNVLSLCKSELL